MHVACDTTLLFDPYIAATYAEYTIYNLVIYAKRMGGSLSRYRMDLSTRISYVTNRCSQKAGT